MWFGRALRVPDPKCTGWDTEEQMCSCLCPHRLCGLGSVVPGPLAVVWWLNVAPDNGCVPRRAQGSPRGSQRLMGAAEPQLQGFCGPECLSSPWGRSQEQHRLGGEMGDCGHRAQLWLRAGDPTGATGRAPLRPSVPVGLCLCQVQPLPRWGCRVGGRDPCHQTGIHGGRREPPAGSSGGTALLPGARSSQATSGH